MRVKMLTRNPDEYLRETKHDIHKIQRNYDPALHPFEVAREYTRALNAVKLERIFAKPFLFSLDGHQDGVQCMIKHPSSLSSMVSGAYDGEIRKWNLTSRKCISTVQAHDGVVRGICMPKNGEYFISVGDDKVIKHWSLEESDLTEPKYSIVSKTLLNGISHHLKNPVYATCGEIVQLWEETRSAPLKILVWGLSTVKSIKFNPVEVNLLGGTCLDRSIILYDMREVHPIRKVVLDMVANTISWNPMESFIFTAASEDHNLYTFDLRNLKVSLKVHRGHVAAVLDVDYSPTGKEFATAGYDKTIRIFDMHTSVSRDIYHTQRMQRLSAVLWSSDNKYVITASDEMNIRMWKANASEKLGVLSYRERMDLQHCEKLKEKFMHHPEVKRIARHRHVSKFIYYSSRQSRLNLESKRERRKNARLRNKPKQKSTFSSNSPLPNISTEDCSATEEVAVDSLPSTSTASDPLPGPSTANDSLPSTSTAKKFTPRTSRPKKPFKQRQPPYKLTRHILEEHE